MTYSIAHSSVNVGDVLLGDQAIAVIWHPMWKFAMTLHDVGVFLEQFSSTFLPRL